MIIVPYKAEHLMAITAQEAQAYLRDLVTTEYCKSLEASLSFTAMVDGRPIGCGGLAEIWKDRALLWSFLDRSAKEHLFAITKVTRNFIDAAPYRRIEAETDCEFKEGHRWLRMLGFTLEAERMRCFRVDGGDSALYAKVK